jgi:hypothetical protein
MIDCWTAKKRLSQLLASSEGHYSGKSGERSLSDTRVSDGHSSDAHGKGLVQAKSAVVGCIL